MIRWEGGAEVPIIAARLVIAHQDGSALLDLCSMLERLRHQVIGQAGDAETAWQLTRRLRPALVLLSPSLGDGDSFEAAEAIRMGLDLPVLFVADEFEAALFDRAREAGCDGFLARPFTDVMLEIGLQMALDRYAERRSLQRDLDLVKEKLEARKLINRAKAILMERHGLTEPEAFQRLQSQSMNTATPMKAIAEAIILSAQVLCGDSKPHRPGV